MNQPNKVVITANAFIEHPEYFVPLAEAGYEIGHQEQGPISAERLKEILPGHFAVIAAMDRYNADVLASATDLKIISRWGVGIDNIDIAAATANGIVVTNTPGMVTSSVADMTFALMLTLARDIPTASQRGCCGEWVQDLAADFFGATLGVIGFGSIGQAVAYRARGFDMRVLAFDPYPNYEKAAELSVELTDLDTVVREADYLSLHCNLTDDNRHLIDAGKLSAMKDSAFLINTARGGLVDDEALIAALTDGTIAGAALDTVDPEPPPLDLPVLAAPNCIITPHSSFYNPTSVRLVNTQTVQNILDFLAGKKTEFVLNPEVLG
jgi:D-3-phosphoglycerate dehydrogenase